MHRLIPKSIVCLREGYTARGVLRDLVAGLTVAVIALPLAMAFGIASIPESVSAELAVKYPWLSPPAMGLYTAIVAGFLISALGGSRVQIGGPTGAFIVIVYAVALEHGYEGLALATMMAGVMVALLGVLRFGAMIKFIPYPVTTGFTTGIAVIIASGQVRDFLGLRLHDGSGAAVAQPPGFLEKIEVLSASLDTVHWPAAGVGVGALAVMIVLRRLRPRVPGAIVAVVLSTAAVWVFGIPAETIGERFSQGIPGMFPSPHLPVEPGKITWALVVELIPAAGTIALLCAIESLLSAVVADGMVGTRHKADAELVAQGVANVGSALFFGIPATGAIARTVANIRSGGRTPLAGMSHAVFLLVFMLALAPLAERIPLSALAAVLLMVAWNMSEKDHFLSLLRAPAPDAGVLVVTFLLTVLVDLTVAVGVGVVLASLLFMKRMSDVSGVARSGGEAGDEDAEGRDDPGSIARRSVPAGVEVYEISGPFFFGVADRLKDTLSAQQRPPRAFVLRLRRVPVIDATGAHALREFVGKCRRQGTAVVLSGVQPGLARELERFGISREIGPENICGDIDAALARASLLTADLGS